MDFHIDRRITLSQDSQYKNLYDWCLVEVDAADEQVGRDQIPWPWSVTFTASNLILTEALTIVSDEEADDEQPDTTGCKKRSIRATLRSWDPAPYGQMSFSMFGTDRTISKFELFIYELQETGEKEKCITWGSVSYTAEIDFRDETTEDVVIFNVFVHPDRFAEYAEKVVTSTVDEVIFRARGVAGFYSDWSPSISTDDIKVLTDSEEHKISVPEECGIVPPRLGRVAEAELHFHRIVRFEPDEPKAFVEEESVSEELDERGPPKKFDELANADQSMRSAPSTIIDERALKNLSSLRLAGWSIVALLLLILIVK